ncbi:hypothetical protein HYU19_04265 [Candidatus Woesearchaeota archaeon]|nr:hypothetical protein [Candidatus Woesearchaeota archaeon]
MVQLRVMANEGVGKTGNRYKAKRYNKDTRGVTGTDVILESPAKLKIGDVVEASESGKLTFKHKK